MAKTTDTRFPQRPLRLIRIPMPKPKTKIWKTIALAGAGVVVLGVGFMIGKSR